MPAIFEFWGFFFPEESMKLGFFMLACVLFVINSPFLVYFY